MLEIYSYFLIALAFAEGVIAILLLRQTKRQQEDRQTYLTAQKDTYKVLEKLVTQTAKESQQILQQAQNKQKQLIETVEQFESSLEQELRTTVQNFGVKLEQTGNNLLQKTATELDQVLQTNNKKITNETNRQVLHFNTQTKVLIDEYRQLLLTQAANDQKAAQEQVKLLIDDEKKRLSQKTETVIQKVTQKYLSRTIDPTDTHEIVMKLLETELR